MNIYRDADPREDRLPKWASENLKFLRARVEVLERRLTEISSGTVQSNFWYEDADGRKYYIPRHSRLMFSDGTPHGVLDIGYRDGWPGVYLNGSGALVVKPCAANACYVKSER
jgi:hypothetical protein